MSYCVFQIRGRRHLVFASDKQLELLQQSKTWYIDGTFKLCRQPFTQLLTLNVFVKNDDHVKQVIHFILVFYLTKTYVTLSGTPKKYKGVPLFQRDAKKLHNKNNV